MPEQESERESGRVAVVGAGLAGVACARALTDAGRDVVLLDRGRVPGGRMASRQVAGRYVDTGASYFTVRDDGFREVVEHWAARGLARPWTEVFHVLTADSPRAPGDAVLKSGPVRWAAAGGLRSLVTDLATGLDLRLQTEVEAVEGAPGRAPSVDGTRYAAVVLAMPDPQAADLLSGDLAAERTAVQGRQWRASLALAAGFGERCWDAGLDGAFVEGSPVLAWVADDGRRRGDGAPVLVAHSTAGFAAEHLDDPQRGAGPMVAAMRGLLGLPAEPVWTHLQRWSLASPVEPREPAYHLGEALVGLCGDGWGSPRVETAWTSGTALGRELARRLA